MICPPHHRHGKTLTCGTAHSCDCSDCREAVRDYAYWRTHMHASGRSHLIDSLVPSTGTRRRIQALMTLGWSQSRLAVRMGRTQATVSSWFTNDYVKRSTHNTVARLYTELSDTRPTARTTADRMSINRTIALATRRGWARPIDWDDIDTDPAPHLNPTTPDDVTIVDTVAVELATEGAHVTLTTAERHAAVRVLHARGYSDTEIARMLRCADRTILRDRKLLDLPANDWTHAA